VKALDEVFKAYEEKVKTLEAALKGEKTEKARVSNAAQSLAAKLTSKMFVGK
jgi:putative methionine-R-sulfoxide reductase with GAF domain